MGKSYLIVQMLHFRYCSADSIGTWHWGSH